MIHSTAELAADEHIGAHVVIGRGQELVQGAPIGSGSVIGSIKQPGIYASGMPN